MLDKRKLINIYKRYGFTEQNSSDEKILVFSLMAGHYHNVDIIPLDNNCDVEAVFKEYKDSGYACKTRYYSNSQDAEDTLFKGFFSSDSTQEKFERDYESFTTSIAKLYTEYGQYSYINSSYELNEKPGEKSVIEEVLSRLTNNTPVLFLIEAAAGFGKTCSAYEILNEIVTSKRQYVPLFTELSRNRQAKIFRYVLLDEIDRSFPTLRSSVVNTEIRNGRVPVILDGFDELLHESSVDNGYENTEPMLETIGELLTDKAKIVLTTRRTAIFDGDDFHQWMDDHENDFEVIRIRIHEPTVTQWLSLERLEQLNNGGFDIEQLSNPVLLSYLRFSSDQEFSQICSFPNKLVQKYFDSMFERERVRQDLRMKPEDQFDVLKSLARDMMQSNYTGESREYILNVIQEYNHAKLESIRKEYPAEERPTSDEIANKLASHALLDRDSDETQGIGFVNEFVLGNFCAEIIKEHPVKEWVGDKRFIEPSILSYKPRTAEQRQELWDSLKFTMEFAEGNEKLNFSIALTDELRLNLISEHIEDIKVQNVVLGIKTQISDSIFINCLFDNVAFDFQGFEKVTFMNCHFFDCSGEFIKGKKLFFAGCDTNNVFLENEINHQTDKNAAQVFVSQLSASEIHILEKFWPRGSRAFKKHRPVKGLITMSNSFDREEILQAIDSLKKREYLLIPAKRSFLEMNVAKINQIKKDLGRDEYGS